MIETTGSYNGNLIYDRNRQFEEHVINEIEFLVILLSFIAEICHQLFFIIWLIEQTSESEVRNCSVDWEYSLKLF